MTLGLLLLWPSALSALKGGHNSIHLLGYDDCEDIEDRADLLKDIEDRADLLDVASQSQLLKSLGGIHMKKWLRGRTDLSMGS